MPRTTEELLKKAKEYLRCLEALENAGAKEYNRAIKDVKSFSPQGLIAELAAKLSEREKTIKRLWDLKSKESTRYHAQEDRFCRSIDAIKEGLKILHEPTSPKEKK